MSRHYTLDNIIYWKIMQSNKRRLISNNIAKRHRTRVGMMYYILLMAVTRDSQIHKVQLVGDN